MTTTTLTSSATMENLIRSSTTQSEEYLAGSNDLECKKWQELGHVLAERRGDMDIGGAFSLAQNRRTRPSEEKPLGQSWVPVGEKEFRQSARGLLRVLMENTSERGWEPAYLIKCLSVCQSQADPCEPGRRHFLQAIAPPDAAPAVYSFLQEHALTAEFERFIEIAFESFHRIASMDFYTEQDPEEPDSEWLVLQIDAEGEYRQVRDQYKRFNRTVLQEIGRDAIGLLRLSLNIRD